ncbi:MAG: sulfatase-like hydrolase/transferase [Ferruginibacter sp.]
MKLLKKIPFFLLLLVLFFCLHGWLENYGFIRIKEVFFPGLVIFGCMALLTGILYLFLRNLLYASLIICFFSLWYLFFGALHDLVKSISFLSFLKSYTVMLILFAAANFGWIVFLKNRKHAHHKLSLYINLLLLIYCCIDVIALVKKATEGSTDIVVDVVRFDTKKVTQKPDVFFLLLDGYPGFNSLQDSFNFNNERMQNYLTAHSFKVLPVFANYDYTYFCMSSMFNMQYVKDDFINLKLKQKDFQKRGIEINQGAIFPIFRSMGYTITNLSIFDIDDKPAIAFKNSFLLAHTILLTDKIFHNRLKRDIGDRLGKIIPFWKNNDFYRHDMDNKLTESMLLKLAAGKKSSPEFVYAHFMMPHGPYYYDSLGNKNPFEKISHFTMWKDKGLFISYLEYSNTRVINMLDTIIKHNPEAVIIVMGDHGFRSYKFNKLYQPLRFDNLCAVRFPDNKHKEVKDKWSTVNLFRYIFNSAYDQQIPYLADSSILLRY